MKMTYRDIKKLVIEAAKEIKKDLGKDMSWASPKNSDTEGQKGRDGYVEEEEDPYCQPHGYKHGYATDFSERLSDCTEDGNLYKRQGNANMGPFTSESAVRAYIRDSILREMSKKNGTLLTQKIHISEDKIWESLESFIKKTR